MAEPPSSPPGESSTPEESLVWYKNMYEQLEAELADFRESSHELEKELEKDLEAADKRERDLRKKAEELSLDVDEWKEKARKAKTEANAQQSTLEKEITGLRDSNRTLQLRLRDIEVQNDDIERQARNTTSSLEDMESKYNVAIERTVMMEEEIKMGEQDREKLRMEVQHLRDQLSDLKIEAEIMQDKLKQADQRHLSTISTDFSAPESPTFENSPQSTASSPLISTPPDELSLPPVKNAPETHEPPSPPMSDASAPLPKPSRTGTASVKPKTPAPQKKSRLPSMDHSITPKPKNFASSTTMRPPGTRAATTSRTPAPAPRTTNTKRVASNRIPASNSLTHIRTLTAQMARLEARVHSARSKLPAPITTPPRASPRSSVLGGHVPSTVTVRTRKRAAGSTASSIVADDTPTQSTGASATSGRHAPRLSTSGVSRLSFGPLPNRSSGYEASHTDSSMSRPSSRASVSSFVRPERPASRTEISRPMSRNSLGGARTPLGIRPRSSMSGSIHGHSQSVSGMRIDIHEANEVEEPLRTPSRRGTYSKYEIEGLARASAIPGPSGIPVPGSRRQSGGGSTTSEGSRRASGARKLSDLGETY